MSLKKLTAENIRCLERIDLEPAGNNLIIGENASGKTSLLEAIFILGRGRSFRSTGRESVIQDGAEELMVTAKVAREDREHRVGIALHRERPPRIRIDGEEESSAAALARWVPVQVMDPEIHRLVDQGPGIRRRYLDWGVFHVEHRFLEAWRRYHRAIKQRNALLKARDRRGLEAWDQEVIAVGEELTTYRRQYVEDVSIHVRRLGMDFLEDDAVITYRQGWTEDKPLAEALADTRARDLRFGITHAGPHRADLSVQVHARKARGRVSRGEQKLLAAALILGQLAHLRQSCGIECILLLDDLAAELDSEHLGRLRDAVVPLGAQLFLTALDEAQLVGWDWHRVFHVEQGNVLSVL